jgi:hypothetical protein
MLINRKPTLNSSELKHAPLKEVAVQLAAPRSPPPVDDALDRATDLRNATEFPSH